MSSAALVYGCAGFAVAMFSNGVRKLPLMRSALIKSFREQDPRLRRCYQRSNPVTIHERKDRGNMSCILGLERGSEQRSKSKLIDLRILDIKASAKNTMLTSFVPLMRESRFKENNRHIVAEASAKRAAETVAREARLAAKKQAQQAS